jgi:hypothetical protein
MEIKLGLKLNNTQVKHNRVKQHLKINGYVNSQNSVQKKLNFIEFSL